MESIEAEYSHALGTVPYAKGGQWLSGCLGHILDYDSAALGPDQDAPFNGVTESGVRVNLNKKMFCTAAPSLCPGLHLLPVFPPSASRLWFPILTP